MYLCYYSHTLRDLVSEIFIYYKKKSFKKNATEKNPKKLENVKKYIKPFIVKINICKNYVKKYMKKIIYIYLNYSFPLLGRPHEQPYV